jgi:mono/diheme cytochrome c family protein
VLLALMASVSLCRGHAQDTPQTSASAVRVLLHRTRTRPSDLEIGGDLAGVPAGQTRFVTYADLLKLPQVTATVRNDDNFLAPVRVSGVRLESLPALLGAKPDAHLVTAICDDSYAAHYPAAYLRAHHPILVLKINGLDHAHWPLGAEHVVMGPYMISHADFRSTFQVLAHKEQPQIPWGVVRLDLRREPDVYRPILPIGPTAKSVSVQQGFIVARESCFRCHDRHGEGGTKANRSWSVVARRAITDPRWFAAYVRDPTKINSASQMAPAPQYDDATIAALRAYFAPFAYNE